MPILDPYRADPDRYDERMPYRRVGRSGLKLPAVSLGLWHNFGDDVPFATQRDILRRAFDLGITHFDLANNYGPPYGQAEVNFGTILRQDLAPFRDELVISTKAGYEMWPGPYGQRGGSRKYLLASLDQSLRRLGPGAWFWCIAYVVYLLAFFDPTTSVFRILLPLAPVAWALAASLSLRRRILLLTTCVVGQLFWIGWVWDLSVRVTQWVP